MIADFNLASKIRPTNPRILLDAGPPRAMYKVNPRLIFGKEWWDSVRVKIYASFGNKCAACGKTKCKLEAHEMYKIDKKLGRLELKDIVPLCFDCHSFIHQDMHRSLLKNGDLKTSDVIRILAHGKAVLKKWKIRCVRQNPNDSKIADADWRLVLNGVEYPPVK